MIKRTVTFIFILSMLSACSGLDIPDRFFLTSKRVAPELKTHNVVLGDPIFIRIFKEEHILELWMKAKDRNDYTLIKTYPICNWSGALGPKFYEGDLQAPEGFYSTNQANLNPNSQYFLSFNLQYPNAYDRNLNRTGSFLMVHGDCVSEGCYAMTDKQIEEIYFLVERSLRAGQIDVPVHIFPFKMTTERMVTEIGSPHFSFWMNIREGYNFFENYGVTPRWDVVNNRYDFY